MMPHDKFGMTLEKGDIVSVDFTVTEVLNNGKIYVMFDNGSVFWINANQCVLVKKGKLLNDDCAD